jgi:hypothetical protein
VWSFKKIFSRTTGPSLHVTRLGIIILEGRGLKLVQTKGITLLQGEILVKE